MSVPPTEHRAQYCPAACLYCPPPTPYRGRYAPTPSGPLHLGNLRTALLAWLLARRAGGAFVLRMEDLDRPRIRPGVAAAILADLRWLGLDWDEGPDGDGPYGPYTQSERGSVYAEHLRRLREAGMVYPCYCSRADITRAASAPHGQADEGPRYPGTCRDPAHRERQRRRAAGRPPALRFRVPEALEPGPAPVPTQVPIPVQFMDGLYGPVSEDVARSVGDFVVRRADGVPAYHLAVVVDDASMAVGDVVRGSDLLTSTPRQIVLYHALGYPVPRYLHVPLVVDREGERLAKRRGAAGLEPLRERGVPAERVIGALAASAGLVPTGTALAARDLLARFDPALLTRRPTMIEGLP